jgi:hypothetical protein
LSSWLKREAVATLAMAGAALTVLAQLAQAMPMAPWLEQILAWWQAFLHGLWRPPLDWLGIPLHPHLVAAVTVSAFMTLIGVGARISRRFAGTPLPPIGFAHFLGRMNWPSLVVFAALSIVFLAGQGDPSSDRLVLWGNREAGRYGFALTAASGYFAGDLIGQHEFHGRLLRMAVLVVLLVSASLATLWWGR